VVAEVAALIAKITGASEAEAHLLAAQLVADAQADLGEAPGGR
jgi:hypothetical protein